MSAWETLFDRAMAGLDSLPSMPEFSFGGGTALMLRYNHRESHDIDMFLPDTQILMGLSPRLNDVTEGLTDDYSEDAQALKLRFGELGEVDFIAGPRLIPGSYSMQAIRGRSIKIDDPVEIVAKKCFYRADFFKARDVFDFAVFLDNDRSVAEGHADILLKRREPLLDRLRAYEANADVYEQELSSITIYESYQFLKAGALSKVKEFLEQRV